MAENRLFDDLCTPEVMKIGWHLAQYDSRDDFFADPVEYADFASNLTERLRFLVEEVKALRYRPRDLLNIDVPKSGLSVRPGNVLPIEESVVLHAIVYLLAPKIDPKLSPQVYSYRLHPDWKKRVAKGKSLFREDDKEIPFLRKQTIRKFDPIEPWYTAWPEFDRARREAVSEEGYSHLTKTDITSYFENIDLRVLETQLRAFVPTENHLIQILMRVLESWTRVTSAGVSVGRGIPQGNDVSSFLGNAYLRPLDAALDAFCRQHHATWFRYVDDVDVYSESYATARDAVFAINQGLRGLHLNLQGSKTIIHSDDELAHELDNSEGQQLDTAWEKLQKLDVRNPKHFGAVRTILDGLAPLAKPFLTRPGAKLGSKESRTFRRLMTIFGRAGEPDFRPAAVAALRDLPELRLLRKTLTYLGQLPLQDHESICEELVAMLEENLFPIPYQAAAVLERLRFLHPCQPAEFGRRIRKYAFSRKRDWSVRQKAAEALAAFPGQMRSFEALATKLLRDDHPWVRRAGCVLLTRGNVQFVRDQTNRLIYHPDPHISRLAIFWSRHLGDETFALEAIARMKKSRPSKDNYLRQLAQLWLLRASPHVEVVRALRLYVRDAKRDGSGKLDWQFDHLEQATLWVATA
jgi:hypothetical protein